MIELFEIFACIILLLTFLRICPELYELIILVLKIYTHILDVHFAKY